MGADVTVAQDGTWETVTAPEETCSLIDRSLAVISTLPASCHASMHRARSCSYRDVGAEKCFRWHPPAGEATAPYFRDYLNECGRKAMALQWVKQPLQSLPTHAHAAIWRVRRKCRNQDLFK